MRIYSIVVIGDYSDPKIWKSFSNYNDAVYEMRTVRKFAEFFYGPDNFVVKIVDNDLED